MKEYIDRLGEKLTIPLMYCLVPLTGLPFLFEPDSFIGKLLLLCKFGMMAILYVLNISKIAKRHNAVLGFVTLVMLIITIRNGTLGVFFLLMILYMSFILFPLLSIPKQHKKNLLLLLCLVTAGVFVYSMAVPISQKDFLQHKEWFIHCYSPHNANTCGYLLLSAFMYLISLLDEYDFAKKPWIVIFLCLGFGVLQYITACRTALLIIAVFTIGYIMNQKKLLKPAVYYIGLAATFLFCLVYCLVWSRNTDSNTTTQDIQILGKDLFSGREKIWLEAFRGFLKNPLFGNDTDYLVKLTGFSSAHNVLLGILLIVGVIPAIVYVYFMASPEYILSIKKEQEWKLTIPQLCFMAGIISTAFECSYTDARLNFLLLPLLSICSSEKDLCTAEKVTKQGFTRYVWGACIVIVLLTGVGVGIVTHKPNDKVYFADNLQNQAFVENSSFVYSSKGSRITDDLITFENTYVAKENETPNRFSSVELQLIGLDGTHHGNLYTGLNTVGKNESVFRLPEGFEGDYYRLRIKGNTNHQDEYVDLMVYLEKQYTYSCNFDIMGFTNDEITLSNIVITKIPD